MIAGRLLLTATLVVAPSAAPTKLNDIDIPCLKQQIAACDAAYPSVFSTPARGWCYMFGGYSCLVS